MRRKRKQNGVRSAFRMLPGGGLFPEYLHQHKDPVLGQMDGPLHGQLDGLPGRSSLLEKFS